VNRDFRFVKNRSRIVATLLHSRNRSQVTLLKSSGQANHDSQTMSSSSVSAARACGAMLADFLFLVKELGAGLA